MSLKAKIRARRKHQGAKNGGWVDPNQEKRHGWRIIKDVETGKTIHIRPTDAGARDVGERYLDGENVATAIVTDALGQQDSLDIIERQTKTIKEYSSKGTINSTQSRKWSNTALRSIAKEFIRLLDEQYPYWRKCEKKRLSGSHGKGGLKPLLDEACKNMKNKSLKNSDEAKKYIRRGLELLKEKGNDDAEQLLSKPWF